MPVLNLGPVDWGIEGDKDGYRDYHVLWLLAAPLGATPREIYDSPEIPPTGDPWPFDFDSYATAWPDKKVSPAIKKEVTQYWIVDQHYSNRPLKRCQDTPPENPMDEPPKLSGGFLKRQKAASKDRNGDTIKSSSHEPFGGKIVEFDEDDPTVKIEMNLLILPLTTATNAMNCVNDDDLWGLSKRCIRLANFTWQRNLYGSCNFYYTITYDFDTNADTFDRDIQDEGEKCLIGWSPGSIFTPIDPDGTDLGTGGGPNWKNPLNFERYRDKLGELTHCILDGKGRPVDDGDNPGIIHVEKYAETPTSWT